MAKNEKCTHHIAFLAGKNEKDCRFAHKKEDFVECHDGADCNKRYINCTFDHRMHREWLPKAFVDQEKPKLVKEQNMNAKEAINRLI